MDIAVHTPVLEVDKTETSQVGHNSGYFAAHYKKLETAFRMRQFAED